MKKIGKRLISLLLALVTLISMGMPTLAAEPESGVDVDAPAVTAEGSNDLGVMLADEITHEQSENKYGDGNITAVTMDGATAHVDFSTSRDAELVVAAYDESSGQMTASASAWVAAGTEGAEVTLIGELPETYLIRAYLLDAAGHEPLCEEFTSSLYTKGMQNLLDSTIEDYSDQEVLNLDADPSNNFLVYAEEATVVEAGGPTDVLTDNGDGTYTITNATETFTSLQKGDVFSYAYSQDHILLVKVASIHVNEKTVTVTKDENVQLEDFFEYVKIDVGSDELPPDDGVATVAKKNNSEDSLQQKFKIEFDNSNFDGLPVSVSGTGSVTVKLKIYIANTNKYVEFTTTAKTELNVSFKGKILDKTPTKKLKLIHTDVSPFPGLNVNIDLDLKIKIEAELEISADLTKKIGFAYDDGTFVDKSTPVENDWDIKLDGKLSIAIVGSPGVSLLYGVVQISLDLVPFEFEVKTTLSVKDALENSLEQKRHPCYECWDGDISVNQSISLELSFLYGQFSTEWEFIGSSVKIADFYVTKLTPGPGGIFSNTIFGMGTCPFIHYEVTLTVVDRNDRPLQGALLTYEEGEDWTDEHGVAKLYMVNGSHPLQVAYEDEKHETYTKEVEVYINDQDRTIKVEMDYYEGGLIDSGECGAQGDNLTWTYDVDNVLTIKGSGDMADYEELQNEPGSSAPWAKYKNEIADIVIEDGVTHIGDYAFHQMKNPVSVVIPGTIKSLGKGSFKEFTNLEKMELPGSVSSIGENAFASCRKLSKIKIHNPECDIFPTASTLGGDTLSQNIVIYGFLQSTAQEYARKYAYKFFPLDGSMELSGTFGTEGDNLKWEFHPDTQVLTISGSGAMENFPNGYSTPWAMSDTFSFMEDVLSIEVQEGVTSIGDYAFAWDDNFEDSKPGDITTPRYQKVKLPYTLRTIGNYAFWNHHDLQEVYISNGVTSIGDYAFYSWQEKYATHYDIPGSVKSIGAHAFYLFPIPGTITLHEGLEVIGEHAFDSVHIDSDIPSTVKEIGEGAFTWVYFDGDTLTLPKDVTGAGPGGELPLTENEFADRGNMFYGCNLREDLEFSVAEGNTAYSSRDGVLYNADQSDLICIVNYSGDPSTFVVPSSVITIEFEVLHRLITESPTSIGGVVINERNNSFIEVSVEEGNINYSSIDGILYNGDGTVLLACPRKRATDFIVPATVEEIRGYSCYGYGGDAPKPENEYNTVTILNKNCLFSVFHGYSPFQKWVTIKGYAGSTAETYAKEHGNPFVEMEEVLAGPSVVDGPGLEEPTESPIPSGAPAPSGPLPPEVTPSIEASAAPSETLAESPEPEGTPAEFPSASPEASTLPVEPTAGEPTTPAPTTEPVPTPTMAASPTASMTAAPTISAAPAPTDTPASTGEPTTVSAAQYGVMLSGGLSHPHVANLMTQGNLSHLSAKGGTALLSTFVGTETGHTANFTDLRPRADYVVVIAADLEAKELFAPENILYIAQTSADEEGSLTIEYVPQEEIAGTSAAYGPDPVYSGVCGDGLTWTLEWGVLTISGRGNMTDYGVLPERNPAPWAKYAEKIKSLVIEDGVSSVGDYAFFDCFYLSSASLPESVQSIGEKAFGEESKSRSLLEVTVYNATCQFGSGAIPAGTLLRGHSDSTVEKYAKDNHCSFVSLEDYLESPILEELENTPGGIVICWKTVAEAEKYRVFYKTENSGWQKLIDTTETSYTWNQGKKGTRYYFTVCCVSADGEAYTSSYDKDGVSIVYQPLAASISPNPGNDPTPKPSHSGGASGATPMANPSASPSVSPKVSVEPSASPSPTTGSVDLRGIQEKGDVLPAIRSSPQPETVSQEESDGYSFLWLWLLPLFLLLAVAALIWYRKRRQSRN